MDRHRPDAEKGTKVGERDLSMLSAVSLFFLDVCFNYLRVIWTSACLFKHLFGKIMS
jgi:hypothetical protein